MCEREVARIHFFFSEESQEKITLLALCNVVVMRLVCVLFDHVNISGFKTTSQIGEGWCIGANTNSNTVNMWN